MKRKIIIIILIIVTILALVGTRQYKYDQIENSAEALDINLNEVGLWPTIDEMEIANEEVNVAIEDLEKEAKRANVDVDEVTKDATTQAEAIYLVQGALKVSENDRIEIRNDEKFPKLNTLIHIFIPII